ncbi:MAG: hypothetical protein H6Q74_574 [Firmicutes bacterium]|nr:hypothetical protein [Bacillota bacterium]
MEKVCPICNCMRDYYVECPQCGSLLTDGGVLENYFGPYSPYMDNDLFHEKTTCCVHLFFCPNCSYDMRVAWDLVAV